MCSTSLAIVNVHAQGQYELPAFPCSCYVNPEKLLNGQVTAILYANPSWAPAHGGKLRLWPPRRLDPNPSHTPAPGQAAAPPHSRVGSADSHAHTLADASTSASPARGALLRPQHSGGSRGSADAAHVVPVAPTAANGAAGHSPDPRSPDPSLHPRDGALRELPSASSEGTNPDIAASAHPGAGSTSGAHAAAHALPQANGLPANGTHAHAAAPGGGAPAAAGHIGVRFSGADANGDAGSHCSEPGACLASTCSTDPVLASLLRQQCIPPARLWLR